MMKWQVESREIIITTIMSYSLCVGDCFRQFEMIEMTL